MRVSCNCKTCAKHGKRFCFWCFAQSAAFPLEHLVWEKAPGFRLVTHFLGL
jgi:hypothetical protein